MRLPMLRTTPGEMVRCRGTGVVWAPQGQPHLVCGPDSESTRQPWARSARSTSRSFMDGTTPTMVRPGRTAVSTPGGQLRLCVEP